MNEQWLSSVWSIPVTGVGIFLAVSAIFFKADDYFSKEFRGDVSLWLLCLEGPNAKSSWPEFFVQLFDRIFSKKQRPGYPPLPEWRKHLSWACFWRSCVASLAALMLTFLIGYTTGLLSRITWLALIKFALSAGHAVVLLVLPIVNLLPDYLSLLETRYLLRYVRAQDLLSDELFMFWSLISLLRLRSSSFSAS